MSEAKLSSLSIVVKDIEISEVFYSEILGLDVISKRIGHIIYENLDLYSLSRWTEELGKNLMDFYFGVATHSLVFETYNFDLIRERVFKTDWIKVINGVKKDKNLRVLIIEDPDGNLITIKEKEDNHVKISYDSFNSSYDECLKINSISNITFDEN